MRLEEIHGPNFFLDSAGEFWGILDTRPWMRLQSSVCEIAHANGNYTLAAYSSFPFSWWKVPN